MSFTIEALLGIQPKVEDEELPIRIPRSCSEDDKNKEEDIELEGESCCENEWVYCYKVINTRKSSLLNRDQHKSQAHKFFTIITFMQLYETLWCLARLYVINA